MANLSRRSKDNATDLISLKEATNTRDEDIRHSLRELVTNLAEQAAKGPSRGPGTYLLDDKPHTSSQGMGKSFSLPRIPSPASFAASLDRDNVSSPIPYQVEGAAGIALLEKILREMGTKEGQDHLLDSLSEIRDDSVNMKTDPAVTKKLEEIFDFLKDSMGSRALVSRRDNVNAARNDPPRLELNFGERSPISIAHANKDITSHPNARRNSQVVKAADFVSEDMAKLLKRMKDSITEGGGLSAEIKALVRELRGEVLGMGREIGRKLEQVQKESSRSSESSRNAEDQQGRQEVDRIVADCLVELKDHMDRVMQERRRQSSSSIVSKSAVDSQEIYNAVKGALSDMPLQQQVAVQNEGSGIEREEILEAVREAWETYKPEIELQNFGLERDEILQCLKEGLQGYQSLDKSRDVETISYEEVVEAVQEGLKSFKPPPVETGASITREEVLMTVRECLESLEFPAAPAPLPRDPEITREEVLDAVKEGLSYQTPVSKELEFNREDLFDAVRAGLEDAPVPMAGVGEQVLEKIEVLIEEMRGEFKQYSAANGRDTEQVLDAMKDGLEVLRADVETYVDRAADVTGKDEIIDTVRSGLEHLRIDIEGSMANISNPAEPASNVELLDAMEKEFEHLRQTIATSMVRSGGSTDDKEEIIGAIREGFTEKFGDSTKDGTYQLHPDEIGVLRTELNSLRETLATTMTTSSTNLDKEEIVTILRDGLESIRADTERTRDRPESILSNTSELLDAFNEGLDNLRTDIDKMVNRPLDMTVNYEILDTLKEGLAGARADIDRLHDLHGERSALTGRREGEVVVADGEGLQKNDIENLEVMIAQLRMKVEALDGMPPPPAAASPSSESFESLKTTLTEIQASVIILSEREHNNLATKDDIDAIETLLRNTKAHLDATEGAGRSEHLDSIELVAQETRDAVEELSAHLEASSASKADTGVLEAMLKEVRAGLEEIRERVVDEEPAERVTKTDIEALETLCMDTKTQIDELILPDVDTLPTKSEVKGIVGMISNFEERVETDAELTAQAFESRKIEHAGIADKVEDVKVYLDGIRQELKGRLEDTDRGVQGLSEMLEAISESIEATDATLDVKEIIKTMNSGFEGTQSEREAARLDHEQHHEVLLRKHDEDRASVIADLTAKIDVRFDELMTKYDDAQLAADVKTSALGDKDAQQAEALNATRTAAEDLKILIDALGSTVTASCDRMSEDCRTVYTNVESIAPRLDELHQAIANQTIATDAKAEHQLTRAEVSKALVAVEGVQAHATDYHPRILSAITNVLDIVGQHYEQAQRSTEEIKTSVNAIPLAIPMPAITARTASPELVRELPATEKYDDSEIRAKLDTLVECVSATAPKSNEPNMLEQVKEEVAATAHAFNEFVKVQQAAMSEMQGIRSREAEEVAIALEKRLAQKESVEADVVRLSDEKYTLSNEIELLKKEREGLVVQKIKARSDLSSLHTALEIRREEMHIMEARAERLEKRILEGVIDHSRSLLTQQRPQPSLKEMNLKRVASSASNSTTLTKASSVQTTVPSTIGSTASSGLGMALKRRPPVRTLPGANTSTKTGRRVLSLNPVSTNRSAGVERSMVLASGALNRSDHGNGAFASGGLKRSHSVKASFPARKASWGGTKQVGMYNDDFEDDKENSILDEEDEEDGVEESERRTSYGNDTERRTSYAGTYTATGSYCTGSTVDEEDERRRSLAASTVGTVGKTDIDEEERAREEATDGLKDGEHIHEALKESPDQEELDHAPNEIKHYHGDEMAAQGQISNACEMVVFGQPSDSGIGADLPTGALEGVVGGDYFKSE